MTRKDIIGTRLLKCPECKKWVQYTPMYFKTRKLKCLVSTCKHNHVRVIEENVKPEDLQREYAPQDEYLIMHKREEKE